MKEQYMERAREHNRMVDAFMAQLEEEYGSKISLNLWFEINTKIREQNFWSHGIPIVHEARANGIDLKINAQNNKICYGNDYDF